MASKLPPLQSSNGNKTEVQAKPRKQRPIPDETSPRSTGMETEETDAVDESNVYSKPVRKKKKVVKASQDPNDFESELPQVRPPPRRKSPPRTTPRSGRTDEDPDRTGTTNDDENLRDTAPIRRKKRKRKATKKSGSDSGVDNLGLAAELYDMRDDVVTSADEYSRGESGIWKSTTTPAVRSNPTDKLYVEQRNGFKSTNKTKLAHQREMEAARLAAAAGGGIPVFQQSTIEFALWTHKGFKIISLVLQGLFAGIALWHVVATWTLTVFAGFATFLVYYSPLAMPVQCMYYFLFAVCTVAAFDKFDVGRPDRRFVIRSISMQTGTISCLFYLIGLIFSLSIAPTDDKMWLYQRNATLWSDPDAMNSELSTWRVLNLMRALGAMLGWIIIALQPTADRLSKNLRDADENRLELEGMAMEVPPRSNGQV